jgi:DinB family protein
VVGIPPDLEFEFEICDLRFAMYKAPMTTTDLRYPVGEFAMPASITPAARAEAIETIAALPMKMRAAVSGLSESQLDTRYRPGGWTVRQVVHHVPDSHVNAYIRLKLAITENNPTIKPYDQDSWAQLPDQRMPIDVSLSMLDAVHARWTTVLRALTTDQFSRPMLHPEIGPITVDYLVQLYSWHSRHHVAHITRLRDREGW